MIPTQKIVRGSPLPVMKAYLGFAPIIKIELPGIDILASQAFSFFCSNSCCPLPV